MPTALSPELIRQYILADRWYSIQAFQVSDCIERVVKKAIADDVLKGPYTTQLFNDHDRSVVSVLLELVLDGIVAPGRGDSHGSVMNFPTVHVTPFGVRCFGEPTFLPYDSNGFVQSVVNESQSIDPIAVMYISEALLAFRKRLFLGSVILIGVASECIFNALRDAFKASLPDHLQEAFVQDCRKNSIKSENDALIKRLAMLKPHLEKQFFDLLEPLLGHMFDIMRECRNDVGHPRGRTFAQMEVYGLFQMFACYCKTSHRLIDWLKANRISTSNSTL